MKVSVSSSCRFEKDWPKLNKAFSDLNCEFVFPDVKSLSGKSKPAIDRILEKANRRFFKGIETCIVLYVYCPEGYIGKGVAAEIGYALAKGKEVVSSEDIKDFGIWSLVNKVYNPNKFKDYLRKKYDIQEG